MPNADAPSMIFRRVVSDALEEQLASTGSLRPLVDRAMVDPRVDVQLRRRGGRSWVSFYCGLTSVLDIIETNGRFRFGAAKAHRDNGEFDPQWASAVGSEHLEARSTEVLGYLERILAEGKVLQRYTRSEGLLQASIMRSPCADFGMIQREALPAFESSIGRDALVDPLWQRSWNAMCAATDRPAWWPGVRDGGAAPRSGLETDLVGVDACGRFLVVEVKPSEAVKGMTWSPGQVRLYAEVFAAWTTVEPCAAVHLGEMADQRARLSLPVADHRVPTSTPVRIAPVIAAGPTPVRPVVLERLRKVHEQLSTDPMVAEVIDPIELWEFDGAGQRTNVTVL